jgi:hypothetical protein
MMLLQAILTAKYVEVPSSENTQAKKPARGGGEFKYDIFDIL